MAWSKLIKIPDLGTQFNLISEGVYTKKSAPYDGPPLFYLQLVQIWKQVGVSKESSGGSQSAMLLAKYYRDEIVKVAEKLLDYYKTNFSEFEPQCIVRAPTDNRDLQQDVFNKFHGGLTDLSRFLKKVRVEEEKNVALLDSASGILGNTKRILIIDDVYATGSTVKNIINKLGREKSYVVVCPLFVEQR